MPMAQVPIARYGTGFGWFTRGDTNGLQETPRPPIVRQPVDVCCRAALASSSARPRFWGCLDGPRGRESMECGAASRPDVHERQRARSARRRVKEVSWQR